jgi:hypothetical protein
VSRAGTGEFEILFGSQLVPVRAIRGFSAGRLELIEKYTIDNQFLLYDDNV